MGKTRRKKKSTRYISFEGERERIILDVFRNLYQPDKKNINIMYDNVRGGNADRIVSRALKNNDRDKVCAWLDEDFDSKSPLSEEIKNQLAKCWNISEINMEKFHACKLGDLQSLYNQNNRKPCLIVSQPLCVESLILKILGHYSAQDCKKTVTQLKNKLSGIIQNRNESLFYQQYLTHALLEEKIGTIPELKFLISMLTK